MNVIERNKDIKLETGMFVYFGHQINHHTVSWKVQCWLKRSLSFIEVYKYVLWGHIETCFRL
jgi:hypothetical protein